MNNETFLYMKIHHTRKPTVNQTEPGTSIITSTLALFRFPGQGSLPPHPPCLTLLTREGCRELGYGGRAHAMGGRGWPDGVCEAVWRELGPRERVHCALAEVLACTCMLAQSCKSVRGGPGGRAHGPGGRGGARCHGDLSMSAALTREAPIGLI